MDSFVITDGRPRHVVGGDPTSRRRRGVRRALALFAATSMATVAAAGAVSAETGGGKGTSKEGGRLVIGLDNEPGGWNPGTSTFTTSSISVALAIFDTLMVPTTDGRFVPHLAESLEPNADYTVWTLKLRDGVTFHDGTPFTAAAVKASQQQLFPSIALGGVASTDVVDDLTLTYTMKAPWATFPASLSGQYGMIAAPSMLENPEGSRNPVGAGPFVFEQWEPDRRLVVSKNPDYFLAGDGLPYLDEVEFRPIENQQSAVDALVSGEIDAMETHNPDAIASLRETDGIQINELGKGPGAELVVIFNTARAPFDNVDARRAVSMAIDREEFADVVYRGVIKPATFPWATEKGYSEPEGFVGFDPAKAKRAAARYAKATGNETLSFEFTAQPAQIEAAQLLKDMLAEADIEMEIKQQDQGQGILDLITGEYQAQLSTFPANYHPDQLFYLWDSANVGPIGTITSNLARYVNPELQAVLDEARATSDEAKQRELYAEVAEIQAENVPFVNLIRLPVALAAKDNVGGLAKLAAYPLPGGGKARQPYPGGIAPVGLFLR